MLWFEQTEPGILDRYICVGNFQAVRNGGDAQVKALCWNPGIQRCVRPRPGFKKLSLSGSRFEPGELNKELTEWFLGGMMSCGKMLFSIRHYG